MKSSRKLPHESAIDVLKELQRRRIRLNYFEASDMLLFTPKRKATTRMVERFEAHEREIRKILGLAGAAPRGARDLK